MRAYLVTVLLVYLTSIKVKAQDCPAAWWSNPNQPTWSCYLITNKVQRSWQDARTFCKYMGGDLLKIDTAAEMTWLYRQLDYYNRRYQHEEWWIGLSDNVQQTGQQWVDNTVATQSFLTWFPGEPAQYDRALSCVDYYNGTLRHQSCSAAKYFICERSKSSVVWCDARGGWETINGKCYKVTTKMLSWNDSRAECQKSNGDLMVIEDDATETMLYNFIESRRTDMWIGLRANKAVFEYAFKWVGLSNKNLDQLHAYWSQTIQTTPAALQIVQSSNGTNACVMANHTMAVKANWQMVDCGVTAFSVCQKPQGVCASGWIQNGAMCYQTITRRKSKWADADLYCNNMGGNMLTIRSATTQTFVNGLIANLKLQRINAIWLGLSDAAIGKWTWSNNIPLYTSPITSYDNLDGTSLTDIPGQLDCVNIFTDDTSGTWRQATNCNANNSFICEIPVNKAPTAPTNAPGVAGSTAVRTTAAPWGSECGPHWVLDPVSNYCFKFSDYTLTWFQAKKICEDGGGQLASIANFQEQKFIGDRLVGYHTPALWIGLNNLVSHKGFHWIDGTGLSYINWSPGEPNNVRNNEHCGEFVTGGPTVGKWNDIACNTHRGYVCKKKSSKITTPPVPTTPRLRPGSVYGCPAADWYPYQGSCFHVNLTSLTWDQSRKYCQSRNSELASIANENEQNFLFSTLPLITGYLDQFWIGLNDIGLQMSFKWSDNTSVTYTNWAANEPNNWADRPEDCVALRINKDQNGEWNDSPCDKPMQGFICKTTRTMVSINTPQMNTGKGCSMPDSRAYGNKCFKVMTSPSNWNAANGHCGGGGNLAVIENIYEQAFLASQVASTGSSLWIGMSNNQGLKWINAKPITFTAWSSNHTGNEPSSCIYMGSTSPGVGLWVNQQCGAQLGYICQYSRSGWSTPYIPPTTTLTPATCPTSWQEHNGYCYRGYITKKNWFEARDACQAMHADLVSLHSADEESFALGNAIISSQSIWIGYNDFDVEKGYRWSDNSAGDYTNWDQGEPNDGDGTDDCVEYNRYNNKWNDNSCYVAKGYVCKIKKGVHLRSPTSTLRPTLPPLCGGTTGWYAYNGSCYYISAPKNGAGTRKSWYDARDYCVHNGGNLASIHSVQETNFLITLATREVESDSWIGLSDVGVDQFAWADGTPFDYTHWSGGEPNDAFGSEKCGMIMAFNGHWNDNNCNDRFHFICKRPQGGATAATIPPTVASKGGCRSGFSPVSNANKCYAIYGGLTPIARKNFTDAMTACRALGTGYDIASVNSKTELATIVSMTLGNVQGNSGLWIGMNDMNNNRRWSWVNNQRTLFTNWDKSQPQAGGKCVEMMTDMRHAGKWRNINCADTAAYVCEGPKDLKYTPQTKGTCTMHSELIGFFDYPGSYDCYHINIVPLTWSQAQQQCQTTGTTLMSILNVYEQAFIDTVLAPNEPFWIGLADPKTTGTYTWSDNYPVTYTSWNKGQPTYTIGQGCVATQGGKWNDTFCQNKYKSVCKKPMFPAANPTPNPGGFCKNVTWTQFGTWCYYLELNPRFSWATAEANCRGMGMELASVHSTTEQNFILQLIDNTATTSNNVWMGFRKIGGYYQWSDSSQPSFVNWLSNPTGKDCAYVRHSDGKWQDGNCDDQHGYICKTPKLPPTTPGPSTTSPPTTMSHTTAGPSVRQPSASTTFPIKPPTVSVPHSYTTIGTTRVKSTTQTSPGRITPPLNPGQVTIPNAPGLQKQQIQNNGNKDLNGGQISGIVIGALLVLVLVCGVLLFLKRRNGSTLFMFKKFGNDEGFDNAAYDKGNDSINITTTSYDNTSNGHGINIDES